MQRLTCLIMLAAIARPVRAAPLDEILQALCFDHGYVLLRGRFKEPSVSAVESVRLGCFFVEMGRT
jgi:hypothetical protein